MSCKQNSDLDLTYPLSNDFEEYCCFNFEWESTSDLSDHNFMLSTDMAFDSIIIDTSGLGTILPLGINLSSATKYYWKINSVSTEHTETSSFTVFDYSKRYEGVYSATFKKKEWIGGMGTTLDTTYVGDIVLAESDIEGHISFDYKTPFDYKMNSTPSTNGFLAFWDDVEEHPRYSRGGAINIEKDSLHFVVSLDANGGGSRLEVRASLE